MSRFPTGVAIMTAGRGAQWHGATVNSITSLSLDPLLILVCLCKNSTLGGIVARERCFAISILAEGQMQLAEHFSQAGRPLADDISRSWQVSRGVTGCRIAKGSSAILEAELWRIYDGGDHDIYCAKVVTLEAFSAQPLVFFDASYYQVGVGLLRTATR
jgi:flavin reductase (DIM6/NTAB) family NADH-FMN oxidoreductase RutF